MAEAERAHAISEEDPVAVQEEYKKFVDSQAVLAIDLRANLEAELKRIR